MEPSSSPSAGEDPNVCIRFWLGPTNLGILRPHLDVMKEHPVVIEQRDFRFDVYGRPADVANAIAFSFLLPTNNTDSSPQESTAATGPSADVVPQRTFTVNPADRKTDYDLALEHFFGKRNSKEQAVTEMQEPAPWSVVILLSMPFRVIQYLMLVSHGFRTYLVEEPNLEACGRQGISQERLKVIAQPAGLVVAVNNIQLPRLESNPEESPVWLQTDDRKALRAILLGVGKALAQEPVRRVILKGLGQEELALRKSWDGVLDQTYTSGATPNEREWVMDNRTSRQENLAPTEPVIWSEPSVDDRRLQYEKSLGTPTQRRPPPERARHSLRRVSSVSKLIAYFQAIEIVTGAK
ncbi:hypothetical protein BGZ95_000981 [Linnemannia exigua]|uniref:Uncharacterized protein n=1 Tax=Linnemannia exigua TaxID=604196 RepID=A0AAD4D7H2_9FUNG|nr:hypothetical protein BGZ95_000981 [Linnemannia exigua]